MRTTPPIAAGSGGQLCVSAGYRQTPGALGLAGLAWAAALLFGLLIVDVARAQVVEPAGLVDAYETTRNQHNYDAALALFADDASVTDRAGQTYTGKDEIRRFLQLFASRGRFVTVSSRHVEGNRVSWTERSIGRTAATGVDLRVEAVVHDGKITSLVYAGAGSLARPEPARAGAGLLPAAFGLASILLVLTGVLALLGAGTPTPVGSRLGGSRLRGRLVPELRNWAAGRGRAVGSGG